MNLSAFIDESRQNRESWRATDLEPWAKIAFKSAPSNAPLTLSPNLTNNPCLVFVDGFWRPDLSDLCGLPDSLMQGTADKGYTLQLTGQTCLIASPLLVRHIATSPTDPLEAQTNLKIVLGSSCRLTLLESFEPAPQTIAYARTLSTEIKMAEQSKLVHGLIVHQPHLHLAQTKVTLAKGSAYDQISLFIDGIQARHACQIDLNGPLAEATVKSVMLLRGKAKVDLALDLRHNAPQGTSHQYVRAVLGDQSQGAFQGRIVVAKDAQKTDGLQQSRALLLSDQASMSAKPTLEINADDVQCAHGSAIGALDDDALFYLRSRGMNEAEARQLLIHAFLTELTETISSPEIRTALQTETGVWLNG